MLAAPLMNRLGQRDLPAKLLNRCGTMQSRNQSPRPASRAKARRREDGCSAIAVEGDAVQLHAVIDEPEAELLGDPLLQRLELVVDELDDVAGLDVDQMVVVGLRRGLVARAAVPELVPLEDACLFEQAHGAVDGGDRDVRIDRRRPRVERLDVWVVLAVAEHPRNHLALLGDAEALVGAQRLDIDLSRHRALVKHRRWQSQADAISTPWSDAAWSPGRSTWPAPAAARHSW